MALGEFELIARWFQRPMRRALLGPGDDCALLAPTPGRHWAVSTDMLVAGRHFFADTDPRRLGHKALAVNLSDLAACGAQPVAFTLGLALPAVDEAWLDAFSQGLHRLADAHDCELVGGDTTAGPLTISITVFGEFPPGQALRRDGARPGDTLWVSGRLGDAGLALALLQGRALADAETLAAVREALEQPQPRVALGLALRGLAHAAIDVSDGLAGDLPHLLERSGVDAEIDVDALPCSPALAAQPPERRRRLQLGAGDDYELLFTAPAMHDAAVQAAAAGAGTEVHAIGRILPRAGPQPQLRLRDAAGRPVELRVRGHDHFA